MLTPIQFHMLLDAVPPLGSGPAIPKELRMVVEEMRRASRHQGGPHFLLTPEQLRAPSVLLEHKHVLETIGQTRHASYINEVMRALSAGEKQFQGDNLRLIAARHIFNGMVSKERVSPISRRALCQCFAALAIPTNILYQHIGAYMIAKSCSLRLTHLADFVVKQLESIPASIAWSPFGLDHMVPREHPSFVKTVLVFEACRFVSHSRIGFTDHEEENNMSKLRDWVIQDSSLVAFVGTIPPTAKTVNNPLWEGLCQDIKCLEEKKTILTHVTPPTAPRAKKM